jgi:hypothetical protein
MAMPAGKPPPLPSRAYLSTPRPPSAPLHPYRASPPSSPSPLRLNRARRRRPFKPTAGVDLHRRRLLRCSLSHLLLRVVRQHSPASLLFLPNRVLHLQHRSPAGDRPPLRRHASAATLFTRASAWLGSQGPKLRVGVFPAQIRGRERNLGRRRRPRRRAPLPPAQAPPSSLAGQSRHTGQLRSFPLRDPRFF